MMWEWGQGLWWPWPFDGSLLLRAGSSQDLALLEYPLLLRAGKVVSRASGAALGNTARYRLLGTMVGVMLMCKLTVSREVELAWALDYKLGSRL
jgi:hypothetical protein